MSTFSRRRVLLTLGAAPVAVLTSGTSFAMPANLSVGEAMRYLCEEAFPSANQKRDELRDGVVVPLQVGGLRLTNLQHLMSR
jgi:hypothetical protein